MKVKELIKMLLDFDQEAEVLEDVIETENVQSRYRSLKEHDVLFIRPFSELKTWMCDDGEEYRGPVVLLQSIRRNKR